MGDMLQYVSMAKLMHLMDYKDNADLFIYIKYIKGTLIYTYNRVECSDTFIRVWNIFDTHLNICTFDTRWYKAIM